jgi:hypothetical protein
MAIPIEDGPQIGSGSSSVKNIHSNGRRKSTAKQAVTQSQQAPNKKHNFKQTE